MSKKKNGNTYIEITSDTTEKKPPRIKAAELRKFEPLTPNQAKFFEAYARGDYFTMLCGSAGTGKTFIACYKAIEEVLDKTSSFHRVVIVRSAVQSRDLGFTPGSVEEKMSLYEQPYMQICHTLFGRRDAYDALKECGRIEFISTSFIRGMSFDDAVINGCIPVVIMDDVLVSFESIIDIEKFSVRISFKDLHKLPHILQGFITSCAVFIVLIILSISYDSLSNISNAILIALFLPIPGSLAKTSTNSSNFFILSP